MKKSTYRLKPKFLLSLLFMAAFCWSCSDFDKFELPEAGSIADKTPPTASFTYAQGLNEEFLIYSFSNLSSSATEYSWNFGDGNTSTAADVVNTYPDEGKYTVSLTATDALGASSTYTEEIEIIKPEEPEAITPEILEAGFEDNSLPDGSGDGRDSWRCSFGSVMQITSSPTHSGSQAAKWPSDDQRVAYQELAVSPNVDYSLTYYYTMKTSGTGDLTVRVMDGPLTDLPTNEDNTLAMHVGTDQTDANEYVEVKLTFNTGAHETIAILITNDVLGVESRLDDLSIAVEN